MNQLSEKQLSFDCAMKIVNKQKWIQIKDIERLEKFIQNQQATISALKEENEQLRKELKELNRKYIAFSEATDKRLKEMMK